MYIKMNDDKSLIITIPTTIYRGEANADIITFLIPAVFEDKNLADYSMAMRYILPNETGRSDSLTYKPEMYKNYLQYTTPADTRFTSQEGVVTIWLTAVDAYDNVVLKTGEVQVKINPSKNIMDYMAVSTLDQIDRMDADIMALKASKADGIAFDETDSTIQLTAEGKPIGKKVVIATKDCECGVSIVKAEINEEDELLITYSDGIQENLGRVGSSAVYVPHISDRKVLSFTIEDEPAGVPDPVDLNPHDEWSPVDGSEILSDYIWESI